MMIIDAHAHLNAPPELYAYQASLLSSRGAHGQGTAGVTDAQLKDYGERTLAVMDSVGTDVQLISPRPFSCSHSASPAKIVHWWTSAVNGVIARQVSQFPGRLAGVAGLPQAYGESPARWADALEQAMTEPGMVGCILNPDPSEGTGEVPTLGDSWWYPLYEKLVELDVPALIHSGSCQNGRETYSEHFISEESIAVLSLLNSEVFLRYPTLRIIVAHGGGSVPYQIGRWRAARAHPRLRSGHLLQESFDESLRRLWFDTVLHSPLSLELLIRTVGFDRCLFGTEKPGSGSAPNPDTGRDFDDLRPVIESFHFLDDDQKKAVLSGNAFSLFGRLNGALQSQTQLAWKGEFPGNPNLTYSCVRAFVTFDGIGGTGGFGGTVPLVVTSDGIGGTGGFGGAVPLGVLTFKGSATLLTSFTCRQIR